MAKSGMDMMMERMLGTIGIDPAQLVGDFGTLKKTVTETLTAINNRLIGIEQQGKENAQRQEQIIQQNDLILRAFRLRMGEELWTALTTMQESTQPQLPAQQSQPNQPQTLQPEKP